jgi:hypothetical protein
MGKSGKTNYVPREEGYRQRFRLHSSGTKLHGGGKIQMSVLHPIRKPCPLCGRPMKLVRDETAEREHYVCRGSAA